MKKIKVKPKHDDLLINTGEFFRRLKKLLDDEFERLKGQLRNEGFYQAWPDEHRADAILYAFIYDNFEQLDFAEFLEHHGYDLVFGDPEKDAAEQAIIDREEISDRVCEIIRTACADWFCGGPPEITPDTTFDSVELDSLDLVEIIVAIEDQFDITFPEEDVIRFKTPGDIVNYIVEHK